MDTYTLTKEIRESEYLYTIIAPDGRELNSRLSAHDYVASTVNGQFFFKDLNDIGKRTHGYYIRYYQDYLQCFLAEKKILDGSVDGRLHPQLYRNIVVGIKRCKRRLKQLTTIAYLTPCEAKE